MSNKKFNYSGAKLVIGYTLLMVGVGGVLLWLIGIYQFYSFARMFPAGDVNWLGLMLMGIFVALSLAVAVAGCWLIGRGRIPNSEK